MDVRHVDRGLIQISHVVVMPQEQLVKHESAFTRFHLIEFEQNSLNLS